MAEKTLLIFRQERILIEQPEAVMFVVKKMEKDFLKINLLRLTLTVEVLCYLLFKFTLS
jgi:hypothetical protein